MATHAIVNITHNSDVQSQKAVTACFSSKQLPVLFFGFTKQNNRKNEVVCPSCLWCTFLANQIQQLYNNYIYIHQQLQEKKIVVSFKIVREINKNHCPVLKERKQKSR